MDPVTNNYNIILNQTISLKDIDKNNLPIKITNSDKSYFTGSVVKSTLNSILAYDTSLIPNLNNTEILFR